MHSVKPKACVLVYPSVDMANARHPSFSTYANVSHLTPEVIEVFFQAYLHEEQDGSSSSTSTSTSSSSDGNGNTKGRFREELRKNPDVSVLYSPHLHLFPPTLILSAACDPLIDEGVSFAQRLKEEKVDVRHVTYPEIIHGFFSGWEMFPEAEDAMQEAGRFLKGLLG